MTERPILFSGPMVRAILDGSKTQTRRPLKSQGSATRAMLRMVNCHLGQPGDRLWVRETCRAEELPTGEYGVRYLADNAFLVMYNTGFEPEPWRTMHSYRGLRAATVPAIHTPRWASRINLVIKSVRIERLQEISEVDCLAEGVTYDQLPTNLQDMHRARTWYRGLWEQINGAGSWEVNPWVWVIEFELVNPGNTMENDNAQN